MRVRVGAAVLLASTALLALPVATPAPAFAEDDACIGDFKEPHSADATSRPYEELNVERAQELSTGDGVGVAVIDSGIDKDSDLNVAEELILGGLNKGELRSEHGTEVAGLITGAKREGKITGIAPDARLVSIRVYDADTAKDDEDSEDVDLTADAIAKGINLAVDKAGKHKIKVINVSLTTGHTEALKDAVERAQDEDILVVAAVGNRTSDSEEPSKAYEPGENAKKYPASYKGVLGVSATVPEGDTETEVSEFVLASRSTDVAAPTALAVTAYPFDGTCLIDQIATSWSTAMVSGLAAMVREKFPEYNAKQTAARIMETANGSTDDRSVFTGFGVIQPVEALTRDLDISSDGEVSRARPEEPKTVRASAPEPQTDRYAAARKSFVWWGLLAGGALVLAALLRPLFARRR